MPNSFHAYIFFWLQQCQLTHLSISSFLIDQKIQTICFFLSSKKAILNLGKAFENGFDNYSTVRGDPDLDAIKQEKDFEKLMSEYESTGFNPFGFFGKK